MSGDHAVQALVAQHELGTAVQPSSRRLGEIEPFPLHGPGISGYVLHPVNPVDHIVHPMPGALVVGVIVVVVSKAIAP